MSSLVSLLIIGWIGVIGHAKAPSPWVVRLRNPRITAYMARDVDRGADSTVGVWLLLVEADSSPVPGQKNYYTQSKIRAVVDCRKETAWWRRLDLYDRAGRNLGGATFLDPSQTRFAFNGNPYEHLMRSVCAWLKDPDAPVVVDP